MVETSHDTGFWPALYDPFRNLGARIRNFFSPASEASQGEDAYRIAIELPGVSEDDVEITVRDEVITVKGEKRLLREESDDNWYFCERQYGAFSRSFRLPPDADTDRIEAEMKDGVLTLVIPEVKARAPQASKVKIRKA